MPLPWGMEFETKGHRQNLGVKLLGTLNSEESELNSVELIKKEGEERGWEININNNHNAEMNKRGGEKERKVNVEGGGSVGRKKKKKQDDVNMKENHNGTSASPSKSRMEMGEGETAEAEAEASSLCSFPMRRVWRLVRGEGTNTSDSEAARTTNDAVFLINKASVCSNPINFSPILSLIFSPYSYS